MEITTQDVEHIARLARLGITEEEKASMAADMTSILAYVAKLQEVDTTGVEYHYQVEGLQNIEGVDEVIACDEATRTRILEAMPERSGDLLRVKGVFE